MFTLLALLSLLVFIISMVISWVCVFKKKPNKKVVVVMVLSCVTFFTFVSLDIHSSNKEKRVDSTKTNTKNSVNSMETADGIQSIDNIENDDAIIPTENNEIIDDSLAESKYLKGKEYFDSGEYEEALKFFEQAISLDSTCRDYLVIASFTCDMLGRYEDSIKYEMMNLEIEPNDSGSYISIATSYEYLGKYEESLEYHNKGIALDPYNGTHYSGRAMVLNKLGRYSEAFEDFKTSYSLDEKTFKDLTGLRLSKRILDYANKDSFMKPDEAIEFLMFSDFVWQLTDIQFDILQEPSSQYPEYEIRVKSGTNVYFFYVNAYDGEISIGY